MTTDQSHTVFCTMPVSDQIIHEQNETRVQSNLVKGHIAILSPVAVANALSATGAWQAHLPAAGEQYAVNSSGSILYMSSSNMTHPMQ